MVIKIKNGDFVELDFIGKIKETNKVFDTTLKDVAEKHNILQPNATYESIQVVVGEGHMLPGLDKAIVGKEIKGFIAELKPEDAFGKKSAKLLKIVPMKDFKKENIKPFVGLEVNVDGVPGIIRNAGGGRTIVDFNHPLAGKELFYEVVVKKLLTTDKDKLDMVLKLMKLPHKDVKLTGKKADVTLTSILPDGLKEQAVKEIERLSGIKVSFKDKKAKEKTSKK